MFMNYEDSNEIPVKELAEEWDVTPQKIVNMIGVAKKSTMIFRAREQRLRRRGDTAMDRKG